MAYEPSGWYTDPTTRHVYRYWNGVQWTDQIIDGGRSGLDPIPVEPQFVTTPPGPGTGAPGSAEPPPREPTERRSSGGLGVFVVVLVVIFIVAAVAAAFWNDSGGDEPDTPATTEATDTPETTETPRTTETPPTTETPDTTEDS